MTPRRSRALTGGFLALLLAVAGCGYLLAKAAQSAVLESQSGSISEYSLDPTEPGFRAFTEPTPTAMVLHTTVVAGTGADLVGVTLLTAADENSGGTVVTIPSTFANPAGSGESLARLFRTEGVDAVTGELREALRIGFSDVVVLDASAWTTLMTADLPLQLSLPTDLVERSEDGTQTRVVLEGGSRLFSLQDVARLASHRNPDEPSLQVALRHQQVWQSWISRTAGADERPSVFAVGSGFIDVINSLANSEVAYRVLPTTTTAAENPVETTYEPKSDEINRLISQIVPFPEPATIGDRPTVLLLDTSLGTVDQAMIVSSITEAGGLVSILGNGDVDVQRITEVQVHDVTAAPVADEIARSLGLDGTRSVPLDGATAAITVLIG